MSGRLHATLFFALLLLAGSVGNAQTPLDKEWVSAARPDRDVEAEIFPQPVCDDDGVCALFWWDRHSTGAGGSDILGATLSPEGAPIALPRVLANLPAAASPKAAGLEHGFAVVWEEQVPGGHTSPVLRYFDDQLRLVGTPIQLPFIQGAPEIDNPLSYDGFNSMVRTSWGFALFGAAIDAANPFRSGVFVFFIDRRGKVLGPRQRLNDDTSVTYQSSSFNPLAAQPDGGLVAVYERRTGEATSDLYIRLIALDRTPRGPEILINTESDKTPSGPVVASGPDGGFLVAWSEQPDVDTPSVLRARRFSAEGSALGDVFQVNNVTRLDQRNAVITADAAGNYFMAWQSFDATTPDALWDIEGRLFRQDGTPVAAQIRLNQDRQLEQEVPRVAFVSNGTLIAAWQSASPNHQSGGGHLEATVPVVRRFAASPGSEPCSLDGPRISCDLARTGGPMELNLLWGGRSNEVILFGDWDGDGREDLCGYFRGRFRCDVDHSGQATAFERLGGSGDVPLLTDVDGDGQGDPCLWRAGQLLCDTVHDGRIHFEWTVGAHPGIPLAGDLNGDLKSDLCLVQEGRWDCFTQGGASSRLSFGRKGDSFALGDADRDGRADPCLLRDRILRCDTTHAAGVADLKLRLAVPAGTRLLFGNLDGL